MRPKVLTWKPMIVGVLTAAAAALSGAPMFAQTASTPVIASNSVASTTATAKAPTSATPRMIEEAVQRSKARAAKAKQFGKPEMFGSEEPFTFKPAAQ
jgi:hypothetical protein